MIMFRKSPAQQTTHNRLWSVETAGNNASVAGLSLWKLDGNCTPMLIHLWRSQTSGRHLSTDAPSSPQNFSTGARLCVAVNPSDR